MLFKISGFKQGVQELSKIMQLDQDLIQIYMDQHEYQNINNTCKVIMEKNKKEGKKVNYWLQALNYYINLSTKSTDDEIGQYIMEVLDHLAEAEDEDFSPMMLLNILEKAKSQHHYQAIKFKVIKKFILNWIKKQQEQLISDKKETEENYSKIQANEQQIKELQTKAKTYNLSKCALCSSALDIPFVYFACGHGYHQNCINGESYEEMECSTCKSKNIQYINKIKNGKQIAAQPDIFFRELNKEQKEKDDDDEDVEENEGKKHKKESKFDIFAKYLGKGIFVDKNDESDIKMMDADE